MKSQFHIYGCRISEKKGTATSAWNAAKFVLSLGYGHRVRYKKHDVYFVYDGTLSAQTVAHEIESKVKEI